MELRHLRYFLMVAEELHFGRAAERLFMSQQPLSAQIASLERELGVMLFTRSANRISLTQAGAFLRERATEIVAAVDEVTPEIRKVAKGESGSLSIAYCRSAMENHLYRAIPTFKNRYPSIALRMRSGDPDEIATWLLQRDVDLAFTHVPLKIGGIEGRTLEKQRLALVVPTSHPWANATSVTAADIAAESTLGLYRERFRTMTHAIDGWFRDAGLQWKPDHEFEQLDALMSVVRGGMGVTILTASLAEQQRGVSIVRTSPALPSVELAALWRSNEPASAQAAQLLAVIDGQTETLELVI